MGILYLGNSGVSNVFRRFFSENIVTMIVGVSLVFASASVFLTSYVKSESMFKKASEVVSGIISLGIIVYGYVLTGNLILGIMTLFVASMFLVAFTLSYLLPKLRNKSETKPKKHKEEQTLQ